MDIYIAAMIGGTAAALALGTTVGWRLGIHGVASDCRSGSNLIRQLNDLIGVAPHGLKVKIGIHSQGNLRFSSACCGDNA
jgi:hypothetical protein